MSYPQAKGSLPKHSKDIVGFRQESWLPPTESTASVEIPPPRNLYPTPSLSSQEFPRPKRPLCGAVPSDSEPMALSHCPLLVTSDSGASAARTKGIPPNGPHQKAFSPAAFRYALYSKQGTAHRSLARAYASASRSQSFSPKLTKLRSILPWVCLTKAKCGWVELLLHKTACHAWEICRRASRPICGVPIMV